MRVVLMMYMLSWRAGGLAESVTYQASALRDAGIETYILGVRDRHPEAGDMIGAPHSVPHELVGPRTLAISRGLGRTLDSIAPDVVDTHHLWMYPSFAALRWHRRTGRPLIITPRGSLEPWALRHSGWKKRIVRTLFENDHFRRAHCLRALNQAEARSLREMGLKNPICVVPNAVSTALPAQPIPTDGPRKLLFLGRIHDKKGVRELVQAWHAVEADGRDWVLQITGFGSDKLMQALRSMIGDARIELTGPKVGPDRDAAHRDASAFILPSHSEGMPMAVLEAWQAGRPVLMTDACNLPEGFKAGAAIRISPDVSSIAEGLGRLFKSSDSELAAMGAAGRKLGEDHFSLDRMGANLGRMYAWAAGLGDRPDDLLAD